MNKESKILDVGCGTGLSTLQLGRKGYDVLGVDIGKSLIDLAKRNTENLRNVKYKISSFEELKMPSESYDLIIFGTSFHWMDPKKVCDKTNKLLKNKGTLVIFFGRHDYDKSEFLKKLRKVFIKHCSYYPFSKNHKKMREVEIIEKSSMFEKPRVNEYKTSLKYSKIKMLNLIKSFSWVIALNEKEKKEFFKDVKSILSKEKSTLIIPMKYFLITTRKK